MVQDPLWQYLIIFSFGGLSALIALRLVYGVRKPIIESSPTQPIELPLKNSAAIQNIEESLEVTSRQTLLPKDLRIWYRRLHLALGIDHVIVPRVKLSRLIVIKNIENNNSEVLKALRTTGVDFAICASNTLKVLAVVRLSEQTDLDYISDLLKQASIPEVKLITTKEYSTSELRGIFMTKLLPPTARTLSIAV
jgi:hypothetical protein